MMRAPALLLIALPAFAHVLSMSSADLTVAGSRAHYELRIPLYEVAHIKDPDRSIFEHLHFSGGGGEAKLLNKTCRAEPSSDSYLCTAEYQFPEAPDRIDAVCTLHSITVPNHVHLLRAEMGGKRDQAVFDLSFSHATLRFRPPTAAEIAVTQLGGGFGRAWGGLVQILFLAALVLAGRTNKELLLMAAMFLGGQVASVFILAHTAWQPPPRFVEAAAALTVAYLAVEVLLLPGAGSRWLVAAVLGAFHGMYFHLFLRETGYGPGYVLAGAAAAEAIAVLLLWLVFSRVSRIARALRPVQVSACALFAFGMVWFFLRLKS